MMHLTRETGHKHGNYNVGTCDNWSKGSKLEDKDGH